MGKGKLRNILCSCGSGRKYKKCCLQSNKISVPKEISYSEIEKDGMHYGFKMLGAYSNDSFDKNEKDHEKKRWYRPLCNEGQIDRIFNVENSEDYLLKIRADSILDNMRLYRVMMAKREKLEGSWNFINEYSDEEFNNYLNTLNEKDYKSCLKLSKGYVHSDDPNGQCIRSSSGDIIVISESLRYFLYYMNLSMFKFSDEISEEVRYSSLLIALRIMLQSESMDFELDPRGEVPPKIDLLNNEVVKKQLQFVIGHEYSHYLLGHLDEKNTVKRSVNQFKQSGNNADYIYYNKSQIQEFNADVYSILLPEEKVEFLDEEVLAAIYFFLYLEVYDHVRESISPSINRIKTHPDSISRIWNIYKKTKEKLLMVSEEEIESLIENINIIKKFLDKDIGYNIDRYETYGSVYLDEWKKKFLKDRVDY